MSPKVAMVSDKARSIRSPPPPSMCPPPPPGVPPHPVRHLGLAYAQSPGPPPRIMSPPPKMRSPSPLLRSSSPRLRTMSPFLMSRLGQHRPQNGGDMLEGQQE